MEKHITKFGDTPTPRNIFDRGTLLTPTQKHRLELRNQGLTRKQISKQEGVGKRAISNTFREIVRKLIY